MNRACVFVHFNNTNTVEEYVYYYLNELTKIAKNIIFVSTSKIDEIQMEKLSKYCVEVIVRENKGYDFQSWKIGLEKFNHSDFDEIILCNDSCYGPLYPLSSTFTNMTANTCDFWGFTANEEYKYHLQSYFLVFKKRAFESEAFKTFWNNLKIIDHKRQIIENYEVGLTQALVTDGFIPESVFKWKFSTLGYYIKYLIKFYLGGIIKTFFLVFLPKHRLAQLFRDEGFSIFFLNSYKNINITHIFWDICVLNGVPFLKKELLVKNPLNLDLSNLNNILSKCSYPASLIQTKIKSRQSVFKIENK